MKKKDLFLPAPEALLLSQQLFKSTHSYNRFERSYGEIGKGEVCASKIDFCLFCSRLTDLSVVLHCIHTIHLALSERAERQQQEKLGNIAEAIKDEKPSVLPETAACYDVEVVDKAASFEKSCFADGEGKGLQGHGSAIVVWAIKTVNQ